MNNKESLIILGRAGFKYVDEFGTEYFIDSEMIIDENYHFVIYSDSIQLYEDYLKESHSDNIILNEDRNHNFISIEYIRKYDSNISKDKKRYILNRVIDLGKERNIRIKLE